MKQFPVGDLSRVWSRKAKSAAVADKASHSSEKTA